MQEALDSGHQVTMFNRGITNPGLFAGQVENLHGDRESDLSALRGRRWDAVVDVAGYFPRTVRKSLDALTGSVALYLFVSSVSVYADQSVPPVEGAEVCGLEDPEDTTPETYGARKAACEDLVIEAFGPAATIVRPGMIVGPYDPTDRFSYWLRRLNQGGTALAPGDPRDPIQFIDVRDLGRFIVHLIQRDSGGTYNATGRATAFKSILEHCQRVIGSDAQLVWIPTDRLLAAGLDPWMGVPLWIGDPAWKAANLVDIRRALDAGLTFRNLEDTIQAMLQTGPTGPPSSFDRAAEAALLQTAAQS
ncbi:MAG: NAD-dependent epimerase/dehydratase family protein [Acidimicrobiales bacterium]